MLSKSSLLSIALLSLAISSPVRAEAQNLQSWLNNLTNGIQQDASAGALTPNQTADLQNRENKIFQQEQRDLAQNGGYLTQDQAQSIKDKLKGLSKRLRNDVSSNNSNGNLLTSPVLPLGSPLVSPLNSYVPYGTSLISPVNNTVLPYGTNYVGNGYLPYVNNVNGTVYPNSYYQSGTWHRHHRYNGN